MKALHDLKILHRDLKVPHYITMNHLKFLKQKSANVFLNKDGTVKLGDMNVSKVAKNGLLYTYEYKPFNLNLISFK